MKAESSNRFQAMIHEKWDSPYWRRKNKNDPFLIAWLKYIQRKYKRWIEEENNGQK